MISWLRRLFRRSNEKCWTEIVRGGIIPKNEYETRKAQTDDLIGKKDA